MNKKGLSAEVIIDMLSEGLNNLYKNKNHVNSLNVFPVPDGDTGSNMYTTLKDALAVKGEKNGKTKTFKEISNDAIYSSRGNSGTILSMFIKGFLESIPNEEEISREDFVKAFSNGCRNARNCLDKPVEGTIITVMNEVSKEMFASLKYGDSLEKILRNGLKRAKITLEKTPEMLPILKKAGVVDAGGQGFVYILEGAYREYLENYSQYEDRESENKLNGMLSGIRRNINKSINNVAININFDNLKNLYGHINIKLPKIAAVWNRKIEFRFDVEFIIDTVGKEREINAILRKYGDSIIVVETNVATKVHVHTNEPDKVFEEISHKIGSIRNKMVEDMDSQRNDVISGMEKGYEIIVLIKNHGFDNLIRSFNISRIFSVNNPSVSEIVKLIDVIDGDKLLFLVSDKNLEGVTKQAIVSARKNGRVLTFENEAYLLSALLNFGENDNYEDIIKKLKVEDGFKAASITISAKSCKFDGILLDKGDYIAILGDNIIAASKNLKRCILDTINALKTEYSSLATAYINDKYYNEEVINEIRLENPDLEFDVYNIGESDFILLISVE